MTQLRWWTSGIVAVTLLALTAFLLSSGDTAVVPDSTPVVSDLRTDVSSAAIASPLASEADRSGEPEGSGATGSATDSGATGTDGGDAVLSSADADTGDATSAGTTPATGTTSSPGTTSGTASSPAVSSDLRLRIPSLGVDALVVELGYNADGQLDVPGDASSVGWYSISAKPGEAGNALLGGHLNWRGQRGVFGRLDELNDGDLIYLVQGGEEMVYQVSTSRSVSADSPLREVLRAPAPGATLTLFTCGGTFDRGEGEYDHRLVVNAVRVANGAG